MDLQLNFEEHSEIEILQNDASHKNYDDEFEADPDPADMVIQIRKEHVKGNYNEIIVFDFEKSLVLFEPRCCSECSQIFDRDWLKKRLLENSGKCPNPKCDEEFIDAEENKILKKTRSVLEQITVECDECKEEVPYSTLEKHK